VPKITLILPAGRDKTEKINNMTEPPEKLEKIIKGEVPIICDYITCEARGNIPRCYLDIYKDCVRYKAHQEFIKQAKT